MIITTSIETELGIMIAGAVGEGICLLDFYDRSEFKTKYSNLTLLFNSDSMEGESIYFDDIRRQLREYFNGTRKEFSVPVVTRGTDFQQAVWDELRKIPYGSTRSYKEQSAAMGKPDSVRAVAKANGMNRISIIIPCHRVIGTDGKLTGYAGGLERKRWLIDHEKKFSGQSSYLSLF